MVYRPCDLYESDSSYIWYIGRVTSMKAIQAPVILIIKRIIQLGQAMIKNNFLLLFIDILFLDRV